MGLKDHASASRSLNTSAVVEGAIRCGNELVTRGKNMICDEARLPNSIADWVAIPVVVWYRYVTEIVEFLSRVVLMDIGRHTVDCAAEIITAVLDAPEPTSVISIPILSS